MKVVVVIRNNVVDETFGFTGPEANDRAEAKFIETLKKELRNFEDYTLTDLEAILDDGFEKTTNGSVCLTTIVTEDEK